MFYSGIVTRYMITAVNGLYFIILCGYYYNDMTKKPYDYLFQESGQRWFDSVAYKNTSSLKK